VALAGWRSPLVNLHQTARRQPQPIRDDVQFARGATEEAREMSERMGADGGPPMTLGAGLRRWFLRPPRPHGEVIEDRTVSFLELFYDLVYVVLVGQIAHTG
jgi:hypothetical protein